MSVARKHIHDYAAPVSRPKLRLVTPIAMHKGQRTFTARQVVSILGITDRTLTNWRIGRFENRRVLEVIETRRHEKSIRFVIGEQDLTSWLADYRPDLLEKWRVECPPH
jgi:hypothetical protein